MDVLVPKGPGGYGMNISESGCVTSFSGDDSAARLAGVPVKSRIVAVQGNAVTNKREIVQQLKALGTVQQVTFTLEPAASTAPSEPAASTAATAVPAAAGEQTATTRMVVPYFAAMEGTTQHTGVLQKGQTVRVLQILVDSKGKTKVQHEYGWTPLKSPGGELVFDNLSDASAGQLGSVPASPAPVPSGRAATGAAEVAAGVAAGVATPEDPEVALITDAISVFNGRAKHGVRQMIDKGLASVDSLRTRTVIDETDLAKFKSERGVPMEDSSPPAVVRLLRRPWGNGWDLRPSASGSGELCYVHASGGERLCLSKQEIGEYLGEPDEFNQAVMAEWLRMDNYSGLGFDDALRMFLAGFKLPGEAQKIDRFMEAFSAEYFRANPGVFNEQDTAYTLAFSVIMLNTDHFNPSIREDRKMTREQFIGNNRAIDTALTPQYLGAMFDRICSNEIKMDSIDTDDQSSIICYTNPSKHGYLEKKGPGGLGKGAYKKRWFVLKNKLLYYLDEPPALGKRPQLRGFIPIDSIVVDDDEDDLPAAPKGGTEDCLFRIFSDQSSYDDEGNWQVVQVKSLKLTEDGSVKTGLHDEFVFLASSPEEKDEWMEAIQQSIGS